MTVPCLETLRLYSLDLFSETGITNEMKKLLSEFSSDLPELERYCVLSFDETDVGVEYSYRPRFDMVDGYVDLGPNKILPKS